MRQHIPLQFQSTLPVWGATDPMVAEGEKAVISIHAPRVGSDLQTIVAVATHEDFNPRSPCGERLGRGAQGSVDVGISIHAPRVGSDHGEAPRLGKTSISIHAPRVGSDDSTASVRRA